MSTDMAVVNREQITPGQQMVASCSGALLTSLLVTPLDVVKVRLQVQQKQAGENGPTTGHDKPKPTVKSKRANMCSVAARRFMTPLDVVKIRLQAQSKLLQQRTFLYSNGLMDHVCTVNCVICGNGRSGSGISTVASNEALKKQWYNRPGHFTGTFDAFVKIARYEGVTSLYSGLPPTLVMAVPATVVYFTCYDQLKCWMGYRQDVASTKYIPMLAGPIARIFTVILINPLELVRTKMQSQQLSYNQIGTAISISLRNEGIFSLMRGLSPTLMRDVPFSGVYWCCYEYMKALQLGHDPIARPTVMQSFVAGATAGSFAAIITTPFDVVKTQRQMELGEAEMLKEKRVASTWGILRRICGQGYSGLFAGLLPRVLKVAPACAIMISSYEYGKRYFSHRNAQQILQETQYSEHSEETVITSTKTSVQT